MALFLNTPPLMFNRPPLILCGGSKKDSSKPQNEMDVLVFGNPQLDKKRFSRTLQHHLRGELADSEFTLERARSLIKWARGQTVPNHMKPYVEKTDDNHFLKIGAAKRLFVGRRVSKELAERVTHEDLKKVGEILMFKKEGEGQGY
ncbi:hypothetical protein V6N13_085751 [Hibiscus sabdariffa]|uniref:Uncharacterized protein n=1 Tax=Hibiscus sabdariffa TaxID=183260 RepID=A0ABR2FRB4_9ROSI